MEGYYWNFVSIGIGLIILVGQILAFTNKSKLQNIVLNEFNSNPNITVEEISSSTGISLKDIRAIILDLKGSGRLRGSFSQTTGKMQSMEISKFSEKKVEKIETLSSGDQRFCSECGTEINNEEEAQFCAYCGSKI